MAPAANPAPTNAHAAPANAVDLKRVLRGDGGDAAMMQAIELAVRGKPHGHDFQIGPGGRPALARHMSATGG